MRKSDYNIFLLPTMEDIEAEAAAWLTVFGREQVSDDERAEFQEWLRRSSKHRVVFETLSALWGDMEVLTELTDIAEAMPEVPTRAVKPVWRRREFFGSIAATFALVAVGTVAFVSSKENQLYQHASFATAVGEQRTVTLSDGSVLHINTDSVVEVDFTPGERTLRLAQGEVHFVVTKNTQRPFIVNAAGGAVRAVGTAFTVRLRANESIEVTVEEGRVALQKSVPRAETETETAGLEPIDAQPIIAELTAGQSAVFNEEVEEIQHMPIVDLRRKLAWREGLLVFAGDSLSDVVEDISRYTDITIEIVDPAVADMPIGGYFRVGEINALFDALEQTFGLKVEFVTPDHVRISQSS
ncbi:MAG: FecR family protein [Kordiimonadaceae bacterium]|nr:FecR family protein [Kordiimonadaceae bacterium]